MSNMKWIKQQRYALLCLIAGAILPFAFAPFHLFWLAPLPPAVLLWSWLRSSSIKAAAWYGFLFSLTFFAVGVSWLYVSIHNYGGANVAVAGIISGGFILLLTLCFILQGIVLQRLFRRDSQVKRLIAFPLSWVVAEWLRGWLFSGFPWLYLGFSQTPPSPLAGYAPIIGIYGLSFIITFTAALLYNIVSCRGKWRYLNLLAFAAVWLIGAALMPINWTTRVERPLTVTLVQANIPQYVKWQPQQMMDTLKIYHQLTQNSWNTLVIWPEGAIPLPRDEAEGYLHFLKQAAESHQATLISGIPEAAIKQPGKYYNTVIALGNGHGDYAKRHLVPFGEYIPAHLQPLVKWFEFPMSNFVAGQRQQPLLIAHHVTIAPFICYEIAYSSLLLDALPKAELLINLSDDGWFGHSFAAAQQLQMARMRALQSGRYLLTATNNEMTAIIDPKGNIVKQLPTFKRTVLTGTVYPMRGATPWVMLLKWPGML
ncbi:MAG: apolipoprotein N-acyltransferase [Gammaproteobacteria bacterium]|nr:apolipoprotein N-acyltransferase [Gammaproteobacteria bacterium]